MHFQLLSQKGLFIKVVAPDENEGRAMPKAFRGCAVAYLAKHTVRSIHLSTSHQNVLFWSAVKGLAFETKVGKRQCTCMMLDKEELHVVMLRATGDSELACQSSEDLLCIAG